MHRDRHARTARVDNDRRRRPSDGFRLRDGSRFLRVVDDAAASLPHRLAEPLAAAGFQVSEVPPGSSDDEDVQLATFAAGVLTVYRRPLELRAQDRGDLEDAVRIAIGEAVAKSLGIDDDLDDLYGDDG